MKLMDKLEGGKLKNLFATKDEPEPIAPQVNQNVLDVTSGHARRSGETYRDYGFRVAGLSEGSIHTLPPCLQSVYFGIKKEQETDATLQEELQANLSRKKAEIEAEKERKQNQLDESKQKLDQLTDNLKDEKAKLVAIEAASYERNKSEWIALVISGILLIPFTVYFFIFYSSVAYSAFFKEFGLGQLGGDGEFKLSQAIFDGAAIPNAYNDGFGELLFILFMPIIFLAFGFILNRWERETGYLKYIKIPLMIGVAFIFDALLAYEICEKIYNLDSMMQLEARPEYSVGLAAQDPRFWVIICLGFVSYLIWGFVFGYFVKAWENLDLNKTKKKECEEKINELNASIEAEKNNGRLLKDEIAKMNPQITEIESQMGVSARYDLAKIKLELANFFAGWQQYLAALHKSEIEKQEATNVFNNMVESIKVVE